MHHTYAFILCVLNENNYGCINQVWDATAKSYSGILRGNIFQLGNWDECITTKGPFRTQYCLVALNVSVPEPIPLRDPLSLYYGPFDSVLNRLHKTKDISQQRRDMINVGLCVPASCSPGELEKSLERYLENSEKSLIYMNVTYSVNVHPEFCTEETKTYGLDEWDYAFCSAVILILTLVLSSTVLDYLSEEKPHGDKILIKSSFAQHIFLSFSARDNFVSLSKADDSNTALTVLYGVKTMCICIIIMGHRLGVFLSGPISNLDFVEQQYRTRAAWIIFQGDLFVDSFLVLSGILVSYGLLVQYDKRAISPVFIIFLRYTRLTPVYAFIIFYYSSIFYHVGSGPLWKMMIAPEVADCKKNWWTNLLYVNNYVDDKHMCMVHSWFLPCEFHYFIIGTFVILLLKKHRKAGFCVLCALLIASVAVPVAITIIYSRPAKLLFFRDFLTAPKTHTDFQLTYSKSHTRATPYIIGVFAGYMYYKKKDSTAKLSKLSSHSILAVSIIVMITSTVGGVGFGSPYYEYSAIEVGAYAGFHRLGWALGTIGVLFTTSYGHVSTLRTILFWRPWIPLSKLVYSVYLVHMQFQIRSVAITTSPYYATAFNVICLGLGDTVLAFITALCLYLGIEAPFRKIFRKLLMPRREMRTTAENSHETTNNSNV